MTSHRKALEALIDDVDAIKEDLVDPMAHTHLESAMEVVDCLACSMLARLSSAAEHGRKDYLAAVEEEADATVHRITLDFEDDETLRSALEYLGEEDAPVVITGGAVELPNRTYRLWDEYNEARFPATGA